MPKFRWNFLNLLQHSSHTGQHNLASESTEFVGEFRIRWMEIVLTSLDEAQIRWVVSLTNQLIFN